VIVDLLLTSLDNRQLTISYGKPVTLREMQTRTKAFALRVIKLIDTLPRSTAGRVNDRQLLRPASSVRANSIFDFQVLRGN
jgi:hypothetical protein